MRYKYVKPMEPKAKRRGAGGKRAGIEALLTLGVRVPKTVVVSAKARDSFMQPRKTDRLLQVLKRELASADVMISNVAVRSSASIEDGAKQSMAGQFETTLHLCGVDQVVKAIRSVWESGPQQARVDDGDLAMEVLVQEMVDPVVSGAAFSRNPVTGADEVIVEAVEGTSEALLQHGRTPRRWVIREDVPDSEWCLLPREVLEDVVQTTRRVAKALRYPADLEWAYDGQDVWWLQIRPITSLRGLPVYSNRISREYLPGLVKPLVWSINVPMINGAWVDLFERLVGPLAIDPMSLARQFHFRAYFNMSGMGELFCKLGLAEDTLERLLGLVASDRGAAVGFRWKMLVYLPRVFRFMISVFFFHRRASTWVHRATARLEEKKTALAKAGNLKDLLAWSDDMLRLMRDAAQRRIVALLLHMVIGQLGQKALQRHGISDLSQLEMPAPDLDSLDPTIAIRQLAHSFANLPDAERQAGVEGAMDEFLKRPRVESFAHDFQGFLQQFGHLSESGNDFSARPWEEDPAVVLQMVIAQAASGPSGAPERDPSQGNRMAKRWARRVTKRRIDRERVGAVFSQGFYVLHKWTQELERALEGTGIIKEAGDAFFLRLEELRCLAEGGLSTSEAMERIARRKAEMAASASLSLPDQILGDRILGEAVSVEAADELRGIGVSRGIYEGTVSVIPSLEESQRFRAGDVLVVPFSDVAWTPLFSRAGAIIAEAGGVLSHSAIIARELKIPAVVSVSGACDLPDGARVRVDGLDGRVTRLESA